MKLIFLSDVFKNNNEKSIVAVEKSIKKNNFISKCSNCLNFASKNNYFIVGIVDKNDCFKQGNEKFCSNACIIDYIHKNYDMLNSFSLIQNLNYKNQRKFIDSASTIVKISPKQS
tara:strand:- start:875 stop:1219 length:345 start_codon:yes stop_codon:yes gene_type:complete